MSDFRGSLNINYYFFSHLRFTSFALQAEITERCVGTFSAILAYSDLVGNLGYGEFSNEREIASVQRETNYNCDYANQLWLFMTVEKTHCEEQNILYPGRAITNANIPLNVSYQRKKCLLN